MTLYADDHHAETIRVGDVIPKLLEDARRRGQALGQKRATRPTVYEAPRHTPRARSGRPTRLHPTLVEDICQRIEDGVPIASATIAAGIPESTYHSWTKRGREARAVLEANAPLDPKEIVYLEFLERTEGARASALAKTVTAHQRLAFGGEVLEVTEHFDPESEEITGRTIRFSKPDRMALEWYLERSHPAQFGVRRLEITGEEGGPIPIEVEVSARDVLRKRLEQVATRLGEDVEATG